MPQSLSLNIQHFIFSTKHRKPWLSKDIRERLYPYLAESIRDLGCECYRVGGIEDHVHLAVRLSRTITISEFISGTKTGTSKWLNSVAPELKDFAWQEGYGAFSVSGSNLDALINYIENQEEHHKKFSFQEEYRKILKQYGVGFDEEYVWG